MVSIAQWRPSFPPGRLEALYLHWSAGDYTTVFPSYHFCITTIGGRPFVVETHDVSANMRDLSAGGTYAAHTLGRNAFAAGISVMGMAGATPVDFGLYPIGALSIDALCRVGAAIADAYNIPIDADHVMTHAEAAIIDGYFGAGEDERWDIARLHPQDGPLIPQDALDTGEELRRTIRSYCLSGNIESS